MVTVQNLIIKFGLLTKKRPQDFELSKPWSLYLNFNHCLDSPPQFKKTVTVQDILYLKPTKKRITV